MAIKTRWPSMQSYQDPVEKRVTIGAVHPNSPSLVWTGYGYGVTWTGERNGKQEVYFALLDASGNKIGSDVRLTNSPELEWASSSSSSLVYANLGFGAVWIRMNRPVSSGPVNGVVNFTRLNNSGGKVGADVVLPSVNPSLARTPSLGWTGSGYGVVWDDGYFDTFGTYFARLDVWGNIIGSNVRVHDEGMRFVDSRVLVCNGPGYGLSWIGGTSGNPVIYFARLGASGNKIGSDVQVNNSLGRFLMSPSLVWTGSGYGVAWAEDRDGLFSIYFARLDASGNKIGSDVRVTNLAPGWKQFPSLVWNGEGYGVVWQDRGDAPNEIYFARLDTLGNKIGSDVRITYGGGAVPSLVWTGSGYGLAYVSERDGSDEVYFRAFSIP